MAGLDWVARKSLERGSEASIPISESMLQAFKKHQSEDWSWSKLKESFALKNADFLFQKYESRLQHTLFMIVIMANIITCLTALLVIWIYAQDTSEKCISIALAVRGTTLATSLALYIISYQESWFLNTPGRLLASLVLFLTICTQEMATSIYVLSLGEKPGHRFSALPLLLASVFLPLPRWYLVFVVTAVTAILELTLSGITYSMDSALSIRQMAADVVHHVALCLIGLFIRFLMEFRNRKAFLDRRECFESKFQLQYEKDQEERLLLSVLPKHIAVQVRNGIRDVIRRHEQSHVPRRPFTELFVEKHGNVSILYADIVNSVALTASLHVSELVETLNELFGRFDECAERNFCLRIKLLGDCYYCVTGVPDRDPLHADHCVQMGLDMIEIIRSFREDSHLNVDMRIGVHSGNVLSGLLGLRKWQFDIWSRDVVIASQMEQSGKPGCVHITRATKELLQGRYQFEFMNGNLRANGVQKYNGDTFLIYPPKKSQAKRESLYLSVSADRISSYSRKYSIAQANRSQLRNNDDSEVLSSRRRTVLGFSLRQFRQMVSQVNLFMESAIDTMALSKKDQWFKSEGIQPLLLTFLKRGLEMPFLKQRDPLFKYSLVCVFFTACILSIAGPLVKPKLGYFWVACTATFVVIISSIFCFWITFFWKKLKKLSDMDFPRVFQRASNNIVIRIAVFILISALLTIYAIMGMEECWPDADARKNESSPYSNATGGDVPRAIACQNPWYFANYVILVMTSMSVFLRMHFLLKLLVNGSVLAIFASLTFRSQTIFTKWYLQDWAHVPPGIDQCWCVAVMWFLLHLLDRQVEYIGRLDYLWERKLRLEQEEASIMGLVNRTLLHNILPVHVAQYYLNKESMHLDLDSYNEEYSSVAVMFASIPNYMDFYSESLLSDEGRKCLQVLHEIICDFDKLLYDHPFLKLEKIKTIGSTYMVAAGLQPGRNSSRSSYESSHPEENQTQNVLVMIDYAFAMMETLAELNRSSLQDFKLRIGMAVGPVLAGVVGSAKPQYDIWGDTVNLASRMDSTGVIAAIQVTESVANILEEHSKVQCECRGKVFIKGKGWMTTYLIWSPEVTRL